MYASCRQWVSQCGRSCERVIGANRFFLGLTVTAAMFSVLGTAAALWENPFFFRMTPAGEFETSLLAIQSILVGGFVAIKPPACGNKSVTFGSVVHFLGVACPVCNKVLVYLIGSEVLLLYFEPYRVYVAASGALLTAVFVFYYSRDQVCEIWRSVFIEKQEGSASTEETIVS